MNIYQMRHAILAKRREQRWRGGHGCKWLGSYLARLCTHREHPQ